MNRETVTIWTVYVGSMRGIGPVLVSATGTATAKQVRLDKQQTRASRAAFGYRTVIPRDEAHLTPEAALKAWRDECEAKVAVARADLDRALARMNAKVEVAGE